MDKDEVHTTPPAQAPAQSLYPALSISNPPPRRERVMTYVLSSLLVAALLLGVAGALLHWCRAP